MQQLKDDHRNHLLIFPVNKNRRKIWGQIKDSPRYDDRWGTSCRTFRKNLNEANFDIDQFDGVSLCKFGRRKFDGDQFL